MPKQSQMLSLKKMVPMSQEIRKRSKRKKVSLASYSVVLFLLGSLFILLTFFLYFAHTGVLFIRLYFVELLNYKVLKIVVIGIAEIMLSLYIAKILRVLVAVEVFHC